MKLLGISLILLASCGAFAQTVDDCIRASCRTYEDVNTLWCHADPGHFCQCRPSPSGTWAPQVMPCAPGTLYSFRRQTCVHPYMHDALECLDGGGGGTDDPADSVLCEEVPCVTYWEINTLVCHADPKQFCQCKPLRIEPTVWVPVAMPCAADTSVHLCSNPGRRTVPTASQTVQDCINVACRTYDDVNTLWCHADPGHFCQCRPSPSGTWAPQVMPCAPGTLYSFRRQTCVHPPMYDDRECDELGPEGGELELALCEEVPCVTYAEVSTLVCHEERTRFCQCRPLKIDPTVWVPVVMPCAESTSFSFLHQTCTRDELWLNSC
ncbi:hypothetical protein pipiens_015670 [Culex pipiens pipiens]|uniref:Uncharacterized protein n=1 Tax=Culex pipiens pipiens TaxID=38569 RepID=A0ABD1CPE3_CULPP